jgi:hypothetical protein
MSSASSSILRAYTQLPGLKEDLLEVPRPELQSNAHKPLRVVNPDSINPLTDTFARYTGYFNEATAAANTILQDIVNQVTRNQPKYAHVADGLDHVADQVVLTYCGLDAGYKGARTYYQVLEETQQNDLAAVRGVQAGVGQFIFQFLASFYLPALAIRKVIRPTGEKLGGAFLAKQVIDPAMAGKPLNGLQKALLPRIELTVHQPMSHSALKQLKEAALPKQLVKPIEEALETGGMQVVGYKTRFQAYSQGALQRLVELARQGGKGAVTSKSNMAGFLAGMASIPILVKIIDPVVHHGVAWLFTKPTDKMIEAWEVKRYGKPQTVPPNTAHAHAG